MASRTDHKQALIRTATRASHSLDFDIKSFGSAQRPGHQYALPPGMDAPWMPLQVLSLDAKVRLFAKPHFTSSTYTVLITDLCHIWEESLDRKQILSKALELDTSIDPTEDSDQLQLLLEKIKNAVYGLEGTSTQLVHPGPGLNLRLRLIMPLPAPLEDLKWEMRFSPSPDVSMKKHLTLPLITMAHKQRSQIDDLIGHLSAKDHVITKLLDKLEGTGFDLSTVFPGIAGTRRSKQSTTRQQVARQVHEVGAFDEEKWRSARKHTSSTDYAHIMSEIGRMSASENGETSIEDDWIARLPEDFGGASDEVPERRFHGDTDVITTAKLACATSGTQEEDMFERQATPPHLRKSRPDIGRTSAQPSVGGVGSVGDSVGDETTDDDDLDAPPRKASQSQQDTHTSQLDSSASQPSARKLGKLGGPRTTPTSSQTLQSHSQSEESSKIANTKKLGKLGGAKKSSTQVVPRGNQSNLKESIPESGTETESDLDEPKRLNAIKDEDTVAKEPAKPPPKRGGLGKHGGGRKPAASEDSTAPRLDVASTNTPKVDDAQSTKRRAGSDPEQASLVSELASNARRDSPPGRKRSTPSVEVPQESEEQKANRKRDELRRALESKSQPAKKKRKF